MNALGRLLLVTAALLLAGCATYTLVPAVERQTIAGFYSVDPQVSWSRVSAGERELWTVDGPRLQTLMFTGAMQEGDTLYEVQGDEAGPRVRAGMNANEVQEFVVASIAAAGIVDVAAAGLRPFDFAGLRGFRFELDMRTPDGLQMDGIVAGAVDGEDLYLIVYTGTRAHHFRKLEPAVEALLASLQPAA